MTFKDYFTFSGNWTNMQNVIICTKTSKAGSESTLTKKNVMQFIAKSRYRGRTRESILERHNCTVHLKSGAYTEERYQIRLTRILNKLTLRGVIEQSHGRYHLTGVIPNEPETGESSE